MSDVTFVSADRLSPETVWRAFIEGFKGYVRPFDLDFESFMGMMRTEDVDFAASLVALDPAGEPVGLAMLAVRGDDCWCGGLGVAPPRRRQRLGRRLMVELIEQARSRGCPRMRLECIDGNLAARALYDGLGYRPVRRLDVFEGLPTRPRYPDESRGPSPELTDPETVWRDFAAYHPFEPPWQGDLRAQRVSAASRQVTGLALGDPARPTAYVLARTGESDTAPIYLGDAGTSAESADPAGDLAELVVRLLAEHPDRPLVAVNVPEDAPLDAALRALGVPVTLTQTEMVLDL